MTKKHSTLEQDLNDDFGHNTITETTRRLNGVANRLDRVEKKLDAVYDELGEHIVDSAQHREASARNAQAGEQRGLETLAKAANAVRRNMTPEGLLERAEQLLTDPSAVGAVAGYVANGQLAKAADILADAEARADKDDEDGALERIQGQMDEHSQLATISKMGEQLVALQHALNSALSRLARLEARPQAAAQPAQTVAKGAQFSRRQIQQADPRETAEGLMTRAEGVIDSPARIGHLASMAQAGQLDELRRIVEQAELAHETAMKKRDRRHL